MSEWYCRVAGILSGPYGLDELEYLRDRGQLGASDEVRREGTSQWVSAATVPELFPAQPMATPQPALPIPAPVATAPQAEKLVPRPATPAPPTEADRRRKQLMMGTGLGLFTAIAIFLLLLLLLTWGGRGSIAGLGGGVGTGTGTGEGDGVGPGTGSGSGGGDGDGVGKSTGTGSDHEGTGGGSGEDASGGATDEGTTDATGSGETTTAGDGENTEEVEDPRSFAIQELKITPSGGASKTKGDGNGGMFGGGGGGGGGSDGKEFFGVKVKGKIALVCDISGSMASDFPVLVRELRKKFPKDTPLILVNGCYFAPPSVGSTVQKMPGANMPYVQPQEFAGDDHVYTSNNTTDAIIYAVEELKRQTVMFNNDLQDSGSESAIDALEKLRKKKKFALSGRSLNCDAPPRLLEFIKASGGDFKVDPLSRTKSPATMWTP